MRTIGSIERILVVGIVLVIGTILTVAIKGAGDFDQAQRERQAQLAANGRGGAKKEALAKGAEQPSNAPKPALKKETFRAPPAIGTEPPKSDATEGADPRGNAAPEDGSGNPDIKALVDKQREALEGKPAGEKKSGAGVAGGANAGGDGLGDNSEPESAPVVLHDEDDPGVGPLDPKDVPPANQVKEYTYTVLGGDSLERIARAVYGDGKEWRAIAAANPAIGDGQMIRTGDKLKLPKPPTQGLDLVVVTTAGGSAAKPDTAKSDTAKPDPVKSPELSTPPANSGGAKSSGFKRTGTATEHTVTKGDTLMSIALDHYGTKAAWKLIYDANADRIPDKDRIKVGVVLRLPAQ